MEFIKYISNLTVPFIMVIIIIWGIKEKKAVFDLFIEGAKEGLEVTLNLFPTLIGIFLAVGLLRESGLVEFIIKIITPITTIIKIPSEIMPLALIRPISGSAAIGVATDIMKNYGVDTYIGNVASVIMGSTETTFYILAVYLSCVKIKNNRGILIAALTADISSVVFCRILS